MRVFPAAAIALLAIASNLDSNCALAKSSNRPKSAAGPAVSRGSTGRVNKEAKKISSARRRPLADDEYDISQDSPPSRRKRNTPSIDDDVASLSDNDEYASIDSESFDIDSMLDDTEDDDVIIPTSRNKRPVKRNSEPKRGPASSTYKRPPARRHEEEDEEDEDEYHEEEFSRPVRPPQHPKGRQGQNPPRRGGPQKRGPPGRNGGRMVQYNRQNSGAGATAALTKGWEALKSSLPDPAFVKDAALSGITAVQQTTSTLSANIYREVKGLTSSELEQVMLKATSPDDTPVKGKHVERLVGVTYQISSRYDIYDAVLRKLWSKMAEKDWRTTVKALYILHRFAADGAPEHAPALKARLRELRRTRDPKRKDKFFNSKQLLAVDSNPSNAKFRAFMARYAHYVLLRAQCFGGLFEEISTQPKPDKKSKIPLKPITTTALRVENYEAASMLLKAGVACQLKDGEECENTAIAVERVASDLIGLTTAVAIALNRALKSDDSKGVDLMLLKKWCQLYKDTLLPQTKAMVKKSSPKLDAYGLFLPTRMGTTVAPDLLEKGLQLENVEEQTESSTPTEEQDSKVEDLPPLEVNEESPLIEVKKTESEITNTKSNEDENVYDDEYEYDEEEYYEDDEL